jgi:hypothetical protein
MNHLLFTYIIINYLYFTYYLPIITCNSLIIYLYSFMIYLYHLWFTYDLLMIYLDYLPLGVSGAKNYDFNCGNRSFFGGTWAPFPQLLWPPKFGSPELGSHNWNSWKWFSASVHSAVVTGELQYPWFLCINLWNILILSVYINFRMRIDFLGEQLITILIGPWG